MDKERCLTGEDKYFVISEDSDNSWSLTGDQDNPDDITPPQSSNTAQSR